VDGVWVFTYAEEPDSVMEALTSGPAAVVDECLQVGDAVVVWYDHHLDRVGDIVTRVQAGEALTVELGGGGFSLEEGSTIEDFPEGVLAHCAPTAIWYAGDGEVTVEGG
jgi:hypothetical protein